MLVLRGMLERWVMSDGLEFIFSHSKRRKRTPFRSKPKLLTVLIQPGLSEAQSLSPPLHAKLHKKQILLPTEPYVQTTLIDKTFPHALASLSVHRQRRLVCMLFFWEEELVRWRLLDEEEKEIRAVMEEARDLGTAEELKVALGRVWARREMLPGMRGLEGSGGLPGYGEGGTVGIVGGR